MTKKMAAGGQASSYEDMTAGSGSGLGRLQKTSIASKTKTQKLKKGGMAYMGEGGGAKSPKKIETTRTPYESYDDGRYAREKEDQLREMDRDLMRHYREAESPNYRREMHPNVRDLDAAKITDRNRPPKYRSGAEGMIDTTLSNMGKLSKQQEGDYRPAQGFNKGGSAKMAKGGKAKIFEGSAADMAQDKKLAKKRGMSLAEWENSSADKKHDAQKNMKGLKMGGKAKMAKGGIVPLPPMPMTPGIPGRGTPFRTTPNGPGPGGRNMRMKKGGKAEMHDKGCNCMACGGKAKYAKGGKVTFGSMSPLPGTKTVGPIRSTTATGANMKKDGMKGQLRSKASGAKASSMMEPLGMTKMAKGGKVRGAGIAQRGTKFIGEV